MEIIGTLQEALKNPWMLLFLAVWGAGYFIKEYTNLKPQWVLPFLGVVLGLVLIELTIGGAIIGFIIALAQMGAYDVFMPILTGGK